MLDGMVETKALSPSDRAAQVFPPTVPPDQARAQNQTTGPNGLIERQVTKELMELFNIDEQTLNTQGLQVTTTIDPKAQQAAEKAVSKYLDGQDPDMRSAVVSIDPHNGAITRLLRRFGRQRFRLRPGRAADRIVVQGVRPCRRARTGHRPGLPGRQLTADGRRHQDHQRRRRELRDLQYRRGAQAFAEHRLLPADAQTQERAAGRRGRRALRPVSRQASPASITRCPRTARADRPTTGSCWASIKLGRSTWRRRTPRWPHPACITAPHLVQKVVNADGQVLFDAGNSDNNGEQRIDKGGRGQRHRRDAADRRLFARPRPGRRTGVGGQDRHGAAGRHRRQQGCLDGRVHAVAVDGGVGGNRPRTTCRW